MFYLLGLSSKQPIGFWEPDSLLDPECRPLRGVGAWAQAVGTEGAGRGPWARGLPAVGTALGAWAGECEGSRNWGPEEEGPHLLKWGI